MGALAYVLTRNFNSLVRDAAASDVFFLSYIVASWRLIIRLTHEDLAARANFDDEGAVIVVGITLAAILFTCVEIFFVLNHGVAGDYIGLTILLAGAPLGWIMLHTVMTFHYANLYYSGCGREGHKHTLEFPGTPNPEPWDFVYFSFVIGMTAQTSDTAVKDTAMRGTVVLHSVASFFFNTVLIAMAVNAGVTGT